MIAQASYRAVSSARQSAVIILAAGASRRLGRPKQLVRYGPGSLLERTVALAHALRPRWVGVVVGSGASRIEAVLAPLLVPVIRARHWRDGMAASLVAGVRRAPRDARFLVVLTVDQWRVTSGDLARLLRAAGRAPVAASYAGRRGVPAVFPREYRARLLALRGDRGARDLLTRETVACVSMEHAASDLDTAEDLAILRQKSGVRSRR